MTSGTNKRSEPRGLHTTLCARLRVWWNNASAGQIWAVDPNLKILYNIISIVDKENIFTYFGWLDISLVISQNPPTFDRDRIFFQFVNARESTTWKLFIVTRVFLIRECTREHHVNFFIKNHQILVCCL